MIVVLVIHGATKVLYTLRTRGSLLLSSSAGAEADSFLADKRLLHVSRTPQEAPAVAGAPLAVAYCRGWKHRQAPLCC